MEEGRDRPRANLAATPKSAATVAEAKLGHRSPAAEISNALAFFASCIRSGEDWSPTCEAAKARAQSAMVQIEALLQPIRFIDRIEKAHRTRDLDSVMIAYVHLRRLAEWGGAPPLPEHAKRPDADTAERSSEPRDEPQ